MKVEALSRKLVGTSAALGALFIVLRYWFSRKKYVRKLIEDPGLVARRIEAGSYAHGEYDVIIVGGGTAGCAIASRLTEDPTIRVLLIEAGRSSLDMPEAQVPAGCMALFRSEHDYAFYTAPQQHAAGKPKYWPRGKLLGGCSAINGMIVHHGAASDYDEWARLQKGVEGADGWSYKNFFPYFIKFEKYHPRDEFSFVDATLRGANGPIATGHWGYFSKSTKNFVEACVNVGIPRSPDFNAGDTMGAGKVLTAIDTRGRRVTTESAYLTREVLNRPNLKIATKARVTRILFEETDLRGALPRASAVRFLNEKGEEYEVRARKEIVLSAGAVHSPQILMLSGVGPASHLSSMHIPVVVDLPGVGSHLLDHPNVDLHFKDKLKNIIGGSSRVPTGFVQKMNFYRMLVQYMLTGTGPLASNMCEVAAFVNSNDKKLFKPNEFIADEDLEDSASGPNAPDLELWASPYTYTDFGFGAPFPGYNFGLHAILIRPTSVGSLRLRSANPFDPPVIDPNYLATKHDVAALARGVRLLSRIVKAPPLVDTLDPAGLDHPMFNHNMDSLSDTALEQLVRERVETLYHPTSTARMAPLEDGGVVDPMLRVYGVRGLRVADASIFPSIPSGHTMAPAIAVGERAADIIKAAIGSSINGAMH